MQKLTSAILDSNCGDDIMYILKQYFWKGGWTMRKVALILVGVMLVSLLGFGVGFAKVKYIVISTGSTGGTFYPAGSIIASTFNKYLKATGYKWSAQTSGGSLENLAMLSRKEVQMAIAGSAPASWAYAGVRNFKGKPVKNIRYVTALWPEMTQIIYRKGIGIKGWKDLKGKKVSVGPAAGSHFYMKILLKAIAGLTFKDIVPEYMGYGDAVQALENRLIDAAYLAAGIPTSAVAQAYAGRVPVDMLEISDEELARLHKMAPFYVRGIIPKGTYHGQNRDLRVAANPCALIAQKDLPADIVYKMLDAMYIKGLADMKKQHHALTFLSLQNAVKVGGVPFHPGAVKFYREHGIKVPEDLIPPEMK